MEYQYQERLKKLDNDKEIDIKIFEINNKTIGVIALTILYLAS